MTLRRGFTLLELILAIALSGVVIGLAARMSGAASQLPSSLAMSRQKFDRRVNAGRALTSLLRGADFELTAAKAPFLGKLGSVSFSARRLMPSGDFTSLPVQVLLSRDTLLARVGHRDLALMTCVEDVAFTYLLPTFQASTWVATYGPSMTAPRAVQIRWTTREACGADSDSLLVRIPESG